MTDETKVKVPKLESYNRQQRRAYRSKLRHQTDAVVSYQATLLPRLSRAQAGADALTFGAVALDAVTKEVMGVGETLEAALQDAYETHPKATREHIIGVPADKDRRWKIWKGTAYQVRWRDAVGLVLMATVEGRDGPPRTRNPVVLEGRGHASQIASDDDDDDANGI